MSTHVNEWHHANVRPSKVTHTHRGSSVELELNTGVTIVTVQKWDQSRNNIFVTFLGTPGSHPTTTQ